jgi:hypothetical protein
MRLFRIAGLPDGNTPKILFEQKELFKFTLISDAIFVDYLIEFGVWRVSESISRNWIQRIFKQYGIIAFQHRIVYFSDFVQ